MQWTCFIWALNAPCKKQMQRSFTTDWRSGIFGVADCWLKHCVTLRHRPQISSYGPRELTRCNWSCQHLRRPAVETILPDLCKSISRLAALTMAKQEQWKRSDKYIYRSAKQAGKGWKKKRDYEKKKDWKNKWHRLRVQRREGKYKRIDRLRQKKKKEKVRERHIWTSHMPAMLPVWFTAHASFPVWGPHPESCRDALAKSQTGSHHFH